MVDGDSLSAPFSIFGTELAEVPAVSVLHVTLLSLHKLYKLLCLYKLWFIRLSGFQNCCPVIDVQMMGPTDERDHQ